MGGSVKQLVSKGHPMASRQSRGGLWWGLKGPARVGAETIEPLELVFGCLFLIRVVEPRDKAGGVPAFAAHFLHFGIELVDDGRDGQARAIAAGFGERN
jgi:hypothetical protein